MAVRVQCHEMGNDAGGPYHQLHAVADQEKFFPYHYGRSRPSSASYIQVPSLKPASPAWYPVIGTATGDICPIGWPEEFRLDQPAWDGSRYIRDHFPEIASQQETWAPMPLEEYNTEVSEILDDYQLPGSRSAPNDVSYCIPERSHINPESPATPALFGHIEPRQSNDFCLEPSYSHPERRLSTVQFQTWDGSAYIRASFPEIASNDNLQTMGAMLNLNTGQWGPRNAAEGLTIPAEFPPDGSHQQAAAVGSGHGIPGHISAEVAYPQISSFQVILSEHRSETRSRQAKRHKFLLSNLPTKDDMINEIKAFFITSLKRLGVQLHRGQREKKLPWLTFEITLQDEGIEMINWPDGIPKPGTGPNPSKGISGVPVRHLRKIHAAIHSATEQLELRHILGQRKPGLGISQEEFFRDATAPKKRPRELDIDETAPRTKQLKFKNTLGPCQCTPSFNIHIV
ncbi:hypothetical protein C8J56DRAFT_914279 [Mycena floridula]|nr:hypothetical protein C8J56DRAFT_914279 [Mycena floridula]